MASPQPSRGPEARTSPSSRGVCTRCSPRDRSTSRSPDLQKIARIEHASLLVQGKDDCPQDIKRPNVHRTLNDPTSTGRKTTRPRIQTVHRTQNDPMYHTTKQRQMQNKQHHDHRENCGTNETYVVGIAARTHDTQT